MNPTPETASAVLRQMDYAEADAPVLADALAQYAEIQRWWITCHAATGHERELAAYRLVAVARLARAAGRPLDGLLGPLDATQRDRVAASGADPAAIEALLSRSPARARLTEVTQNG